VVFIGGHSRSGSTLISRVLGAIPGFCSVGELYFLWDHGVRRNDRCGCGAVFHECAFWKKVGDEAFGGWDGIDVTDVLELRATVARIRYLPLLVIPEMAPRFRRRLDRYAEIIAALYRGIQSVSGCTYVVDSSKWPAVAHAVRHAPDVDMRMMHVVRSSHGVCYSCAKIMPRPDLDGNLMPQQSPGRTALTWMTFNLAIDAFRLTDVPTMVLRYEDFVDRPRQQVQRTLTFLGHEEAPDMSFIRGGSVKLPEDHLVAGNPMRIRTGWEPLAADNEWRTELSQRSKWLISGITAPGLLRYGYRSSMR
jgi:hypothetical protein